MAQNSGCIEIGLIDQDRYSVEVSDTTMMPYKSNVGNPKQSPALLRTGLHYLNFIPST